MSNFNGKISVIRDAEMNQAAEESTASKYNILAIHGLGSMGVQDAAWICKQEIETTSWLTSLLPTHAHCSRIMAFDYSCETINEGVSIDDVRGLAIKLLEQLLEMLKPNAYVVFIAHDLGGMIVKEALLIAVKSSKYHIISGMTSLLVFFGTPHRVSGSTSWESIASWLLHVSGEDTSYSVQRIIKTSQMLRAANERFDSIKNMYGVINVLYQQINPSGTAGALMWQALDSDSAQMGTHREIIISRDEPHADITKFSSERDEAFVTIYQELRISKGPGIQYMECLEFLSGFAGQDGFAKQALTSREFGDMDSGALRQLEGDELYKSWLQSSTGTLYVQGHLGLDAPHLLSQATSFDDAIAISFRGDARDSPHYGSAQLFASLCHQILCLRPQLFDHVSELYSLYSEGNRWRPRLRVFFSSLLGCPFEGHTVCLIQHMDEMRDAKQLLKDIASMTSGIVKNFKLIVTAGSNTERSDVFEPEDAVVHINPAQHNFESIVDSEVNLLLSNRPSLSAAGDKFREMLRRKFTGDLELLRLPEPSIASIVKVWLMLLLDVADPVTNSSIRRSELLMVAKTDDIYREFLCRILPRRRQNARNALSWMARAFRPLRLDELAIATVFELGRESITGIEDETPVDLAWDVDVNFGDLVQVDSSQTVHVRDSFRDYMLRQQPKEGGEWPLPLDSHRTIARKCLSYISLLIRQGPVELLKTTDRCSDLLSYSVRHWPSHYKEESVGRAPDSNPEQGESQEFVFFNDHDLIQKWAQLYFDSEPPGLGCESTHPLVVSVEVGCPDLARALLKPPTHSSDILKTALEAAIKKGDESIIRMLLASGAASNIALHVVATSGKPSLLELFHITEDDLKYENSQGFTPLHCACQSGYLPVVEELLSIGSDAKAKSNITGQTPLHVACQFGHLEIIARLLVGDADANAKDMFGFTPLHVACKWQQAGSVSSLFINVKAGQMIAVDAQSQVSATALHLAAKSGRVDIVRLLFENHRDLRAGADTRDKIRKLLGTKNADGSTPLHLAAASGHSEVVRELLRFETEEGPAIVLERDEQECIPLHLAVQSGCPDVVTQLLGRENVVKDQILSRAWYKSGAFPIHLAVISGHFNILVLLCKAHRESDTSLDLFDTCSLSPLHVAATSGQVDIAELLLDNNATANIFDWDNSTPLLIASRAGNVQIVKLLLEKGADPDTKTDVGVTPVLAAATGGYIDIVQLLLDRDADPNTKTDFGITPVFAAAAGGYIDIIQLLLNRGADPNAEDQDGINPVMAAGERQFANVVDLLLQNGANADNKSSRGSSLLMTAAEHGYIGIVTILLRKRPNLNLDATDNFGLSPLMLAATNGHAEVTQLLLKSGADPNTGDPQGRKAIHFAAKSGDLKTIQLLLGHPKVEANGADLKGRTPLYFAVRTKSLNAVNEFLQRGASATAENENGESPLDLEASEEVMEILLASTKFDEMADPSHVLDKALRQAATKGYLRVIGELNNHNANLEIFNEGGRSLYHLAAESGCTEVIELLYELNVPGFDQTDNARRTPASYASENGHLAAVKLLAEVAPESLRCPDQEDRTPLSFAASCQKLGVTEYLLESTGAVGDANKADSSNRTPLWFAAKQELTPIVQALLRSKADPNIADTDHAWTALHHAARAGLPEMVNLLLDSDSSMGVRDGEGRTPLFWAAWYGYTVVVSILIDRDAADTPDNSGWQALHAAYDSPEILRLLLAMPEVDVNSASLDGATALHMAISGSFGESATVLLDSGADPLKQDLDSITPLHLAATYNVDDELFSLLLRKANGPLDVEDRHGRTALVAAIEHANRFAVNLMLKTEQFVLGEVGMEEKSVLDVAMESYSSGVMDLILRHGGASISTASIEKILVWSLENDQNDVEEQTMQILRDRMPEALTESHALFGLATKTDNISLAKFLLEFGSYLDIRDEHGWTLSQVVAASESPDDIHPSLDGKHSRPSRWSADHSSDNAEISEENGLRLQYSSESASSDASMVIARSDHPIPMSRRFYFEINVIKGSQENLGIGFGYSNTSKERMPGWDNNSWGLHGADGAMYHADEYYWRAINDDWRYGTGDCIACCIDPVQRKAFFTKNETVIDACFVDVYGRLFPMVGFGEGTEIVANFGGDLASKPFKYPNGLTRNYRVSEEID